VPEQLNHRADVWMCIVPAQPDAAALARCASFLDPDELERAHHYLDENHRNLSLIAHAQLRRILSRYSGLPAQELRFVRGEHGRPELANPQTGRRLRFNMSHTQGLVAVVVCEQVDCGVDVEKIDRKADIESLAKRQFSSSECADVLALSDAQRQRRFLEYWTLKESYIKAIGQGLATPLKAFAFDLEPPVSIRFSTPLDDEPSDWQFALARPFGSHQLAVALRRGSAADLGLRIRQIALP
jgi:4'-phosphopantetheinyl transferase